jgi:hypothetical protein
MWIENENGDKGLNYLLSPVNSKNLFFADKFFFHLPYYASILA